MPPIPPHPDNAADETRTIEDEIHDYEAEGWNVGFAVEFNGMGRVVQDGDASNSADESGFPDTDPETDDEIDQQYAGYQTIPAVLLNSSDGEADQNSYNEDAEDNSMEAEETRESVGNHYCAFPGSNSSSTDPMVIQKVKKMVTTLPKLEHNCCIDHKPVDISLNSEKVDEIRNAMAGFHLAPPASWIDVPDDDQIRNLVISLTK